MFLALCPNKNWKYDTVECKNREKMMEKRGNRNTFCCEGQITKECDLECLDKECMAIDGAWYWNPEAIRYTCHIPKRMLLIE